MAISLAIVAAMAGVDVLLIVLATHSVLGGAAASLCLLATMAGVLGAVFVLPAWIMQESKRPPPRGNGGLPVDLPVDVPRPEAHPRTGHQLAA